GWRLIGKDKKSNSSKQKDPQDVDMCSQSDTTLLTAYDATDQSIADYSTPQPQTKRRTSSRKRAKSKGKGKRKDGGGKGAGAVGLFRGQRETEW
ncbi:hypothetical protein SARC_16340, partial [Sphaeroforma arctica JP610]